MGTVINKRMVTAKTTVEIDSQLLYGIKLKALEEGKSIKQVINECLAQGVGVKTGKRLKKSTAKIGGYRLGGIKDNLRRIDIYEDI